MSHVINAKDLRRDLGRIVERVQRGDRFTVLYRSRPAFEIVPPGQGICVKQSLSEDSLYGAKPVGRSVAGDLADRHDEFIYRS